MKRRCAIVQYVSISTRRIDPIPTMPSISIHYGYLGKIIESFTLFRREKYWKIYEA